MRSSRIAPVRVCSGLENSKSLRSPSTSTRASASESMTSAAKSCTSWACALRWVSVAADRRLDATEQRVVTALGVPVVGDREQPLAVVGELGRQRLAAVVEGRVGGLDPTGADRQARAARLVDHGDRCGRRAAGAVHERQATIRAEQEADADVAARLAAVLVVDRVDLAVVVGGAAGRLDGVDQQAPRLRRADGPVVGGAVVVLDLLDGDQVGRAQVVDDHVGERRELRRRIARVQVLDVERGRAQLAHAGVGRRLARESAVVDARAASRPRA